MRVAAVAGTLEAPHLVLAVAVPGALAAVEGTLEAPLLVLVVAVPGALAAVESSLHEGPPLVRTPPRAYPAVEGSLPLDLRACPWNPEPLENLPVDETLHCQIGFALELETVLAVEYSAVEDSVGRPEMKGAGLAALPATPLLHPHWVGASCPADPQSSYSVPANDNTPLSPQSL